MSNQVIERKPNGQYAKGVSGNLGGNAQRSRHALNSDTIMAMHAAFRRGGRAAIDKVMKQQPAVFLKLLVLLVPREMRVEHRDGVKAHDTMSNSKLELRMIPQHAGGTRGQDGGRDAGAAAPGASAGNSETSQDPENSSQGRAECGSECGDGARQAGLSNDIKA